MVSHQPLPILIPIKVLHRPSETSSNRPIPNLDRLIIIPKNIGHDLIQPEDLDRRKLSGELVGQECEGIFVVPHIEEGNPVKGFDLKGVFNS